MRSHKASVRRIKIEVQIYNLLAIEIHFHIFVYEFLQQNEVYGLGVFLLAGVEGLLAGVTVPVDELFYLSEGLFAQLVKYAGIDVALGLGHLLDTLPDDSLLQISPEYALDLINNIHFLQARPVPLRSIDNPDKLIPIDNPVPLHAVGEHPAYTGCRIAFARELAHIPDNIFKGIIVAVYGLIFLPDGALLDQGQV